MSLQGLLKLTIKLPQDYQRSSLKTVRGGGGGGVKPSFSIASSHHHPGDSSVLQPPANQSVAAIVFGDGSHSRLYPLTKRRSESALPIAGNYRLVDAVVSNCIHSNITKIYALTQYNSTSLNSHLSRAYSGAGLGKEGFVEVIAACQSPEGQGWFQGTADAVRRCLWMLADYSVIEFLILPGHHLYKMDYQKLIKAHRNNQADVTVSVISHSINRESQFGIFKVNAENQVTEYRDGPERRTTELRHVEYESLKSLGTTDAYFNGMGIYVVNRDVMLKLLTEYYPLAINLRSEVIPGAISRGMNVHAYQFDGYWEDMRSIEAYYRANMESINKTDPAYNFFDRHNPLYTLPRHLPPTLISDANISDCVIGDGCILNRCNIKGTIIGMRARIGDGSTIEDSIIMGCDSYNQTGICQGEGMQIPLGIGQNSFIRRAIIDKNARIGKRVQIVNKENVQEQNDEANGYIITGGIVVILRNAVIPDGSII